MADQIPTRGRIVQYVLSHADVQQILLEHGQPPRGMNEPRPGDTLPAIVVRAWGTAVNLQVFLDGPATYWVTSRQHDSAGALNTWHWPARV